MRCPKCKLDNPEIAQRCDCGYDFDSNEMKQSYIKKKPEPGNISKCPKCKKRTSVCIKSDSSVYFFKSVDTFKCVECDHSFTINIAYPEGMPF